MNTAIKNPAEERMLRLPIGYSDFGEVVRAKFDFVDKTLFIKTLFDNNVTKATVITRPRRFGKTLNLSMLQHFLAEEVNGLSTKGLFDGLKIAEAGDEYMQHQGKYPVIFITLKDVKASTYQAFYDTLCHVFSQLYETHYYLLSSPKLTDQDKSVILSVIERRADLAIISTSLLSLSHYIYKHTGKKPWILIDEYDTPIQAAYLHNYYQPVIEIFRGFFGTALKDNSFLERAVVTGILRISKESLFSGVNNIQVYSLFEKTYSEYFGFTEAEVEELLKKAHLDKQSVHIRQWYNGYQIGDSLIYNPWSLINCIYHKGELKPYWVNTSGNELVKRLLARADETIKKDLESLIQGETITAVIDESIVFGDLDQKIISVWSLLLFTGYLKVSHQEAKISRIQCELSVPNQEVLALYQDVVRDWLLDPLGAQYLEFLLSLTEGRVEEFTDRLQRYLVQTLSIFDATGQEPEKFYHGFVLGMMVSLSDTHEVKSNHESGYGRYDVMLIPKDPEALGVILEFKTVRDKKQNLKKAAEEALQQIKDRKYAAELQSRGIQKTLSLGLAFRGKHVAVLAH